MRLTDMRVRNAKPRTKPYKLSDGGGMYLLVKPDGGRYWRLDYRFAGKRCTLSLGVYPTVTLSNARASREEARRLLAENINPSAAKKAYKRSAKIASENTFEAIAREWIANQRDRLAVQYASRLVARLEADIFPHMPRSMRRNCWTCLGRSKSVASSRLPGGSGKFAVKSFDMPLPADGRSTIRLWTYEERSNRPADRPVTGRCPSMRSQHFSERSVRTRRSANSARLKVHGSHVCSHDRAASCALV